MQHYGVTVFIPPPVTSNPILSLTPVSRNVTKEAGATTFNVSNTGIGTLSWTAAVTSGDSWLSITSGNSGTNAGTIACTFLANTDISPRTGTVRITAPDATGSPKDVTVTQAKPYEEASLPWLSLLLLDSESEPDTLNPGKFQFSATTYNVNESGGIATITVTRTGGSDGAVGVHYAMSNGTATAGSDYTAKSGDLSWSDGDSSSKTFTVSITNDSVYEGDEAINLTLSSPTGGAALGAPSSALLTILEDDSPPLTPPQWGATSVVCCPSSSATFSLTCGGITKNSTLANCISEGTWEGWVTTTAGSKTFSWELSTSACGNYTGSFSWTLSAGTAYLFELGFDEASGLAVYVYTGTISNTVSSENETVQTSAIIANDIKASMQLEGKIPLNIPQGKFSGSNRIIEH